MKNNLENMPDAPSKEVIAWRRDFEKELRETPLYRFNGETWEEFAIRLAKKIKEILGKSLP